MAERIPHADTEVRQAFQRLSLQTDVITTGAVGYLLVGAGIGVAPVWQTVAATIDHGSIGGLGDDDHAIYHTDARGDARYFRENEHLASSAGAGDAGKPIVLDDDGEIAANMLGKAEGITDHGELDGLADDDHTIYLLADGTRNLTGNLVVDAAVTIDGRDLSVDGAKLDGIEAGADVTDAVNVAAAGAAMAGGAFHDGFSDFVAAEHVSLPNTIANVLTDHDLAAHTGLGLFDDSSDVDHNATTNTHNLTTDIDHNSITNTHNLTTDINHASITGTHNLTTDIDHDTITNTHNLTTDIDHNALTNYAANQHVVLPGLIAAVLTDHDLAAHTALGLFDQHTDVDHDQTTNYDANKHVDHTGVTLTAGSGLAGGGDISANRSFDLDINSLDTAVIAAGDFVPFWDITVTATNKKITFANFEGALTHNNLSGIGTDDHHAESHNIASHSDTTATGAELETLTDNSMADTLHRHSELSASDGTPDATLAVDADGAVTIGGTLAVTGDISGKLDSLYYARTLLTNYVVSTCFDSYDSCGSFVSGSGTLTDNFGMSAVKTGTTNNSAARRNISNFGWYFTKGVAIARVSGYPTGNTTAFIGMSQALITNLQTSAYVTKHAAFIFNNGTWYASVADGANQTTVDITASMSIGRWEIDGRTSGHVKFSIDGVELADISTNLPSVATGYGYYHWYVNNKLTGTNHIVYIAALAYVEY